MLTPADEHLILLQYQEQQRKKLDHVKMEHQQQRLQNKKYKELERQKRRHQVDLLQLQERHQLEIKPLVVDLLAANVMAPYAEKQIQEHMMNKMVAMERELKHMQCRHGHELNETLERHKNDIVQ